MAEFNIYQDAPNYHVKDERELNVVQRINELKDRQYVNTEDDSTEENELKRAITSLKSELGSNNNNLTTLSQRVGTVPEGHTVCGDIDTINRTLSAIAQTVTGLADRPKILRAADIELPSTMQITTADLYGAIKSNMNKGDILVDEFNLSDGPSGLSATALEHVGILAYCTADNISDGESIYSRAYMIASSKSITDIWNCQLIDGTYTWVQISA